MPRGVPKAGFRMTAKRKSKGFTTPGVKKNVNIVAKQPVKKKVVSTVEKVYSNEEFLESARKAVESLKEASIRAHSKARKDVLMNFAACIERQMVATTQAEVNKDE